MTEFHWGVLVGVALGSVVTLILVAIASLPKEPGETKPSSTTETAN